MKRTFFTVALFTVVLAGAVSAQSGNGWMSRYWDGCKAHCMWSGNVGGAANAAKSCNRSNQEIAVNDMVKDACQGGEGYYCWNHAPVAISATEAYGFVARQGSSYSSKCRECYEITFTGEGQHGHSNSLKTQNKKMTVMLSNIGYDVTADQFDLLVPGGGLGIFDAFSGQLGVNKSALGANHGGFVTDCGHGNVACVVEKCNTVFAGAGREDLRDGCLFYANWLGAANNPKLTWRTVTCPQALIDWYKPGGKRPTSGGGTPPPTTTYTLTVNRAPTAGGTTNPAASQANIAAGTAVSISATAASGYTFVNWTAGAGATITNPNSASTMVTLSANATVTANFTQQTQTAYTLTVERNPTAGGTTTPAASQANIAGGTAVNITATPAAGYRFVNWTVVNGNASFASANNASTTVTLTSNATIRANFVQTITLTVTRSPDAGGTTSPAASQADIPAGTAVSISATPANGYTFTNWTVTTGTASFANANSAATTVTLSANATIRANFAQTYTLTVNRNPTAGGTTTPAANQANIAPGQSVSISAAAAAGYTFSGWVVTTGTATIANANSANTMVTLTSNATITANFTQQQQTQTYTLTVNRAPQAGGTTTPAASQANIAAGTAVDITAIPANGYTFTGWTVTTGAATFANASSPTTTVTLTANATITANFTQQTQTQTYTLTINRDPDAGGATNPAGTQANITAGTAVNISATAASGYTFNNWTVVTGTAQFGSANSASTTVTLSSNATIRANFTQSTGGGSGDGAFLELKVNIVAPGSGRVDVTPNKGLYLPGDPIKVVAVANPGFVFEGWENSGDLYDDITEFNTTMWWHREITAKFKQGGVSVDYCGAPVAAKRAPVTLKPGIKGFTATLPAGHSYTSYKLIDLRGREIGSGRIGEGATDLRFDNIRNSVLFLKLTGRNNASTVLKAVTY